MLAKVASELRTLSESMPTQTDLKKKNVKLLEERLKAQKIPGDDLANKFIHFFLQCKNFAAGHSVGSQVARFDSASAYDVFVSAYIDIDRYKKHHLKEPDQQRSDGVKRAAYFVKWLTRLRPFYVVRPNFKPENPDPSLWLNELFAIEYGFHQISHDATNKQSKRVTWVLNDEQDNFEFLYDLHYRQLSEDALLAFFQMHAYMANGKAVGRDLE